jgi:hypothetical protein
MVMVTVIIAIYCNNIVVFIFTIMVCHCNSFLETTINTSYCNKIIAIVLPLHNILLRKSGLQGE